MSQLTGLPELRDTQVSTVSSAAVYQPGTLFVHRNGNNWGLVQYIQTDNNGCSRGEILVTNFATLVSYSVAKASTDDMYSRPLRGIACATIASKYFGFMHVGGYVEKARVSNTVASGDFLSLSGSTAGELTGLGASPHVIGIARTAISATEGSISMVGIWG